MDYRTSAAYDLSLFETKEIRTPQIKEIVPVAKPKVKKKISAAKYIFFSVVLLAVMSVFVYSHVQLNESTALVSEYTKKLEKAKSEEELLDVELERLLSVKNIEKYATNELGLCKPENYQIEYIRTEEENKIKVTNENQGFDLIESVKEFFNNVFSMFK
ncbi:MAG: hypothetical protein RR549_04650 [Oscillospiraceae bacterium]